MADVTVSIEQVRHVAMLARLALSDAELDRVTRQLQPILGYVDQIGEVDVTHVEPLAHALPLSNILRDDVVGTSLSTEQVLRNAPASDGPFFKVPKILGANDDSAG